MTSGLRVGLSVLLASLSAACTSAVPTPQTPASTPPVAAPASPLAPGADPFPLDGAIRDEQLPLLKGAAIDPSSATLPAAPAGVAAEPSSCSAYLTRSTAPSGTCSTKEHVITGLAAAFQESSPDARDTKLAALESCTGVASGVVRAVRAELAPECAEGLVSPVLRAPPKDIAGNVYGTLMGLAVGGRLARLGHDAPTMTAPFDKKRVLEFLKTKMMPWLAQQSNAVDLTSQLAVKLDGYAKGIAAIEAGAADLRLVDAVRSAPIPDEFKKDRELADAYYGNLDVQLDPRKSRGRDGALVGLRELASAGVIEDGRVERVRKLLSKLYGGHRVDALDDLVVPTLQVAAPTNAEERVAAGLPAFYAGLVLDESILARPRTLALVAKKGLPITLRRALATDKPSNEAKPILARARFELGRAYFRNVDFDQAAQLAHDVEGRSDDTTLVLALAIALRNGPDDAAGLMRSGPLGSTGMGKVDALDRLAQSGALAGVAAFDAARIKEIVVPEGATSAYFDEIAKRYRDAASKLTDAKLKALAEARAAAAEETSKAIGAKH
jgi:hypothetical protein